MRRIYLGKNVFEAAYERVREQYEVGNTVVCSLSGGKDSGVCLELCIKAARDTGNLPVHAMFQDEEIMYPGTAEYVERCMRRTDEISLKWFCCFQPMVNVFNRASPYFWIFDKTIDPSLYVRPLPDWHIPNNQINLENLVHPHWYPVKPGKELIDVIGLRVSESSKRMLGLVSSGGHLCGAGDRGGVPYRKMRPIYDWTDADVWKAHHDHRWDYNKAYDVMVRMGVKMRELRIGPPTMSIYAADKLKVAAKAWPRWFDRVCARLPGVRQAAQFGALVARPRRRIDETWEQCYNRVCVDEAPADWIRQRAILLRDHMTTLHAKHSTTPLPNAKSCFECGGAGMGGWRRMTEVMFNGDPYSLRLLSVNKSKFPYMEPEFFRKGTGSWNGTPGW